MSIEHQYEKCLYNDYSWFSIAVGFGSLGAVEGGHVLLTSQNGGQYFGWEIVMTIKITFKI